MNRPGRPAPSARRSRGATFVEYAMLLGLFAAAASAGIGQINRESGSKVGDVQAVVGELPKVQGSIPTSPTAGGGGGGTTTAPPATTAAPTTTSTTSSTTSTTTTVKPTTTTAAPTTTSTTTTVKPPTTTTKAPTSGGITLPAPTTSENTDNNTWAATSTMVVKDNNGMPIAGAKVNVKIRKKTRDQNNNWQWVEETKSYTTNAEGKIVISSGDMKSSAGVGRVNEVQFVIESAQMPNNLAWDQQKTTVSADRP